jgi:predicted O-methyltransferase YrrM
MVATGCAPFDFIFIDADKSGYPDYLAWTLKLSRPGAMIIADNVVRNAKVLDPSSDDPDVQGIRRFNELLAAEPRLSATTIQTVGSKGYDGFALAMVEVST